MNAEIRRTKARLLEELPKLQRLAFKKVHLILLSVFACIQLLIRVVWIDLPSNSQCSFKVNDLDWATETTKKVKNKNKKSQRLEWTNHPRERERECLGWFNHPLFPSPFKRIFGHPIKFFSLFFFFFGDRDRLPYSWFGSFWQPLKAFFFFLGGKLPLKGVAYHPNYSHKGCWPLLGVRG